MKYEAIKMKFIHALYSIKYFPEDIYNLYFKKRQTCELDNWRLLYYRDASVITGAVTGHPKIHDCWDFVSSRIIKIDKKKMICYTRNTDIKLLKPHQLQEKF